MGDAKRRGNYEERKAQSIQRRIDEAEAARARIRTVQRRVPPMLPAMVALAASMPTPGQVARITRVRGRR